MKTPYSAPPLAFRRILGPEGYEYLERMHGLIQGLGDGEDETGDLDIRNFGIKQKAPGALLTVDDDGYRAKPQAPFVENFRSRTEGFLQADKDGNISAAPVVFEAPPRTEFAAPVGSSTVTPAPVVSSSSEIEDLRRYALMVS